MKYSTEIEINVSIARFIELFDNPDNMKHWQEGFISFAPLSGTPGQAGAKSTLKYKMGKGELEMIETITVRNLPKEFSGTYEAKGVFNIQKNLFYDIEGKRTRWVSETEFQFTTFMMKVIGFLMPGAFKKQSMKFLVDFKKFAESAN